MIKKLTYKTLLLLALLIVMNFVYSRWFYEKDIQKYSPIVNLVRKIPPDADIIYVGESSNITFRPDDLDKRSISSFLSDFYPGLKVYDITKPAAHAGIYKVLLRQLPENGKPQTVVVTLNLRSFDAQWIYSGLETPLQKSLVLLRPYPPLVNRFMLSFKAYDIKSKKEREEQFKAKWANDRFDFSDDFPFQDVMEWDRWMADKGVKDSLGNYDKENTVLACHYIKSYGFQLDTTDNPRIKDFDDIIRLARERNWHLVFNLMAENTQKAKQLVGDDLIFLMNDNARKLESYFENRGVTVVNNLNAVESDQYIDQNWTTEHYAEKGRKTIAHNVAQALKNWYAADYKEADYKQNFRTEFFNDCEGSNIWGQMPTLTTERAYSGLSSSKTGGGNDYSVTFEYPLKRIPDSLQVHLDIDLRFYFTSVAPAAKLVVQAEGENIDYYWQGYPLGDTNTETNKWLHFHKTLEIPEQIKQADLLKIYVYNPSEIIVYVDDIRIKFEK